MNKQFFVGRQFVFFLLCAIGCGFAGITLLVAHDPWCLLFLFLALIFSAGVVFSPHFHVIDRQGIRIYYVFLWREDFLWRDISSVVLSTRGGIHSVPLLLDVFYIDGKCTGPDYFFMQSEISRTRRARLAIQRFGDIQVEGYLADDVRHFLQERREKSKSFCPSLQKAIGLEQESRAVIRRLLHALNLPKESADYFYKESVDERDRRPTGSYTYCVRVSYEEQTLTFPLVSVRAKKSGYFCKKRYRSPLKLQKRLKKLCGVAPSLHPNNSADA